jgi:polar amino acid transport system substrate-binding protein
VIAPAAIGFVLLLASSAVAQPIANAVRHELAPAGRLRVGINHGNVILAVQEPGTGELRGVHVDLARELARRAGVPVDLRGFASAAPMVDALARGELDTALLSADPAREGDVAFSPAYLDIQATYLVPAGSPLRQLAEVDRDGVRLAVADRSAYDLFLRRSLRRAQLVRAPTTHGAFERFAAERLDALVGLRPRLEEDAARLPGSRILEGGFMTIEQAFGVPRGRPAAARYVDAFVEAIRVDGFLRRTLDRFGVRGVAISAPR